MRCKSTGSIHILFQTENTVHTCIPIFVESEWLSGPRDFQIEPLSKASRCKSLQGEQSASREKSSHLPSFLTQPTDLYFPDLTCANRMVLGPRMDIEPLYLLHSPNTVLGHSPVPYRGIYSVLSTKTNKTKEFEIFLCFLPRNEICPQILRPEE